MDNASRSATDTARRAVHYNAPAGSRPAGRTQLGVDIALLWRGDMLAARFFPDPAVITLGPRGTFVLPEDAVGHPAWPVVLRGTSAGFGLNIRNPNALGHVIVDGTVRDIATLRSQRPAPTGDGQAPLLLPLTAGTRAVVSLGAFTVIISREPVPPTARFSPWSAELPPLILCWFAAAALVTAPLIAARLAPARRQHGRATATEVLASRTFSLEDVAALAPPPSVALPAPKTMAPLPLPPLPSPPLPPPSLRPARRHHESPRRTVDTEPTNEARLDAAKTSEDRARVAAAIVAPIVADSLSPILLAMGDVGAVLPGLAPPTDSDTAWPGLPGGSRGQIMAVPAGAERHGREIAATTIRRPSGLAKRLAAGPRVRLHSQRQRVRVISGRREVRSRGELTASVIRSYIRRNMGAIRACYQKGLQANPALAGKVEVRFLIQPSGSTLAAKVRSSSLHDAGVERCIVANVATWRFPRAAGGGSTRVNYPFRFSVR